MNTFIAELHTVRAQSGLSYKALARRMQASPGSLHRIFNGEDKPRRDTLIRLAIALGLDVPATDAMLRLAGFPGLLAPSAREVQTATGLQRIE